MKAKHHLMIWVFGFAAVIGLAFLLVQGAKKGKATVAAANGGDAGATAQYGTSNVTTPAQTVINLYDNGSGALSPSVGTSAGSPSPTFHNPDRGFIRQVPTFRNPDRGFIRH